MNMNINFMEPEIFALSPMIYSKHKSHSVHLIEKDIINRNNLLPNKEKMQGFGNIPSSLKENLTKLTQNKQIKTLNKHGLKLDFNSIVYNPLNENTSISSNSYKPNTGGQDSPKTQKINNNFRNLKNILDKNIQLNQEKDSRTNISLGFPTLNMRFLYGHQKNNSYIAGLSPYKANNKSYKNALKPQSPSTLKLIAQRRNMLSSYSSIRKNSAENKQKIIKKNEALANYAIMDLKNMIEYQKTIEITYSGAPNLNTPYYALKCKNCHWTSSLQPSLEERSADISEIIKKISSYEQDGFEQWNEKIQRKLENRKKLNLRDNE